MADNPAPPSPIGHRTDWLLAPALAGLYPVLSLYISAFEDSHLKDAAIYGVIIIAAAIALAYLFRLIFAGTVRASLAACVLVAWTFMFSSYLRGARTVIEPFLQSPWNDYLFMSIWLLVLFLAMLFLFRARWSDDRMKRLYQFVELACLFSVGFTLFQGIHTYWGTNKISGPPTIWASDREAMPADWKPAPTGEPRDIYYLLFDRYANLDTLKKFFDYDNSEFYSELEERGFIVDRHAKTSYPMTVPSMASTLNMRYLTSTFGNISDYSHYVDVNDAAERLITAGYSYFYFGNQYEPLRKSQIADWNMKISMLPCEFADSLVTMTPLRPLIGRQHKRNFVLEKFARLVKLAESPKLTFTYAHFLVPHPPYAFARDGSSTTEIGRNTTPEPQLYVDQLVATNRMILTALDGILANSKTKPIIVLNADEGPYLMDGDEKLSREDQIEKRTGILNAIYIPDEPVRNQLSVPPSPVNAFRFLFKQYFGAPIDLLPDHVFYWELPQPTGVANPGTRIIDVTHGLPQAN